MTDAKRTPWELTTPEEILRRAQEHAQRWAQASLATDLCDQEKIEELLKKRAKHLGIAPRKPVWCASFDELILHIAGESSRTLLCDEALLEGYKKSVGREVMAQVKTAVRKYSPAAKSADTLRPLRERIQESLNANTKKNPKKSAKSQAQTAETIEHLKEKLREYLRTLYAHEKNRFGPIENLWEFWGGLLDFSSCRFYDCLWECLPDKRKIKNYFAYMGEMHEAGLWIYIPSKTAEYLIPIPSRFFTGDAKSELENAPRIEWGNSANQHTEAPAQTPQASYDTDRILKKLDVFLEKIERYSLHEDVAEEAKKIVQKISHLLMRLKKEYPSSSLTYEVRRIADSWVIELVTSYANLSQTNREKKRQSLLESLTLLDGQIDKILEEIELRRVSEFDIIRTFLRDTFGANSLEA